MLLNIYNFFFIIYIILNSAKLRSDHNLSNRNLSVRTSAWDPLFAKKIRRKMGVRIQCDTTEIKRRQVSSGSIKSRQYLHNPRAGVLSTKEVEAKPVNVTTIQENSCAYIQHLSDDQLKDVR